MPSTEIEVGRLSRSAQDRIGRALWEMFSTTAGMMCWEDMKEEHKEAWRGFARRLPLEEAE